MFWTHYGSVVHKSTKNWYSGILAHELSSFHDWLQTELGYELKQSFPQKKCKHGQYVQILSNKNFIFN